MAVWFMRWLQCTDAGTAGTPTNDRRDNVLHTRERAHVLNHGGNRLKGTPSRRQIGQRALPGRNP
jgi:hypothetical protein